MSAKEALEVFNEQYSIGLSDDYTIRRALRILAAIEDGEGLLMEKLADIEHERWAGWMWYMWENYTNKNVKRWEKQMITPYKYLPEHSKESDRKEVRKTFAAIKEIIGDE